MDTDAGGIALFVAPAVLAGLALAMGTASCQRDAHGRVLVRQGECHTCHAAEYDATSAPPHPGLFPVTCGMCHSEIAWIPAEPIQHDWFILANRHATEPCTNCHILPGGFSPGATSPECVACHEDDYLATTRPPHVGALPMDCATCHTDAGWVPSTFNHPWTLDGAHLRAPCSSCHGEPPTYLGTPRACVDCHGDELTRAVGSTLPGIPDHTMVPRTCGDCHGTDAWVPAIGGAHPEGRFPIGSGPHQPFGSECTSCHNPALGSSIGGMNTDCVGCHTGEHANTDGDHTDVAGYPTGARPPNFCLTCHPMGRR